MAVTIDRTPLAAVGKLAERGGRARQANIQQSLQQQRDLQQNQISASASNLETQITAQQEQQRLSLAAQAEAQFRTINAQREQQQANIHAQREQQELSFRKELDRQDNAARLNREAQEHNIGLQNAVTEKALLTDQKRQSEAMDMWETLRDEVDPVTFVQGMVSIKSGKVPPMLRQGASTTPPRSPQQIAAMVAAIKGMGLGVDVERSMMKEYDLATPLQDPRAKEMRLSPAGRSVAREDAQRKLPSPKFFGRGTYTQEDLNGPYKDYLYENGYDQLGGTGRQELDAIWRRAILELNKGEGALYVDNQYEWDHQTPSAQSVRDSFARPSTTNQRPVQHSDPQIDAALVQARKDLGPNAARQSIEARAEEILALQ